MAEALKSLSESGLAVAEYGLKLAKYRQELAAERGISATELHELGNRAIALELTVQLEQGSEV